MAQKKQVLFVCYGLGIGGIEKCLVNLINILPEADFDVDVMLLNPQYNMMPQIRRNVYFYDEFEYVLYAGGAMDAIRSRGGIGKNLGKLLKLIPFRYLEQHGGAAWKLFRPINKHYDIAIAYSQNGYALYYVIDKVHATRKVLWYHNGAYEPSEKEYRLHKRYYPQFDSIVAVSRDCAAILKEKLPFVRDKILVLRNICDAQDIQEKAKAFCPKGFADGRVQIVTVGRMSKEKGTLLALEACHRLVEQGYNICWHWVGGGPEETSVQEKVKQLGLEDRFILEGNQNNPYPFIAKADIYVQPSYYEAYSTTVTEAKVLCKPMVVTDVGGMHDQLIPGKTGLIVSVDAQAIAEGVNKLLEDVHMRDSFSKELHQSGTDFYREFTEYERTVFR